MHATPAHCRRQAARGAPPTLGLSIVVVGASLRVRVAACACGLAKTWRRLHACIAVAGLRRLPLVACRHTAHWPTTLSVTKRPAQAFAAASAWCQPGMHGGARFSLLCAALYFARFTQPACWLVAPPAREPPAARRFVLNCFM